MFENISTSKLHKKTNFIPLLLFLISSSFLSTVLAKQEKTKMDNLELIFVYELVRNGARGPISEKNSLFINEVDEFRVSWYGEGDGELSLVGKREHYDIGVRNRIKYGKGPNGLGLIDFSNYDPKEILIHVTDSNRTHQSINSELIGMYQPGILKTLSEMQVNGSFPPNEYVWSTEGENDPIYNDIINEIKELGNKTIIDNIPVFNVHPFPSNRISNLETNCKNLDKMRKENIENKTELLYGYFLEHSEELRKFFQFEDNSFLTNINFMNSITDHYICDYKNYKDLSIFHEYTGIDLEEFMEQSGKFYHNWMYNYYCSNITCVMEASRLMEDLLGYMERRIRIVDNSKSYKAPKMVIDCAHGTTVGPMQMFMYEAWEDKPEYGINTQYCGFACNIYFELYKTKDEIPKYYVFYYIDDDLKHVFEYNEFYITIRNHIYSQTEIEEYCSIDDKKEEKEEEEKAEENMKGENEEEKEEEKETFEEKVEENREEEEEKEGEIQNETQQCICEKEGDSFSESFKNHTALWVGFFITCFTTLLGILGIIYLWMKLRKKNNSIEENISPKMQELTSNFMSHSDS